MILSIIAIFLTIYFTLCLLNKHFEGKLRRMKYTSPEDLNTLVEAQVRVKLNEIEAKVDDPNQEWYEFYEHALAPVPAFAASDKELGTCHARENGITKPFIVKTTVGEYKKHIEELKLAAHQNFMQKLSESNNQNREENDGDGWDEELYGKHPDGEI